MGAPSCMRSVVDRNVVMWCIPAQKKNSCVQNLYCDRGNTMRNFDVLLTVHLSIISVINQLDAQNLVL